MSISVRPLAVTRSAGARARKFPAAFHMALLTCEQFDAISLESPDDI